MEGGFGSDFGSSGGGKLDPGLIMEQVKVQIAVANAQELLQVRPGSGRGGRRGQWGPPGAAVAAELALSPQRMTDKCFRKCIGKPGGSLDNSEQVRRVGLRGGTYACADQRASRWAECACAARCWGSGRRPGRC